VPYLAARFGVGSSGKPGWPVSRSPSVHNSNALFIHRRQHLGDLPRVEIGGDARIASARDHRRQFVGLKLLERPLERVLGDRPIPCHPLSRRHLRHIRAEGHRLGGHFRITEVVAGTENRTGATPRRQLQHSLTPVMISYQPL
jgi:hypothetical protein